MKKTIIASIVCAFVMGSVSAQENITYSKGEKDFFVIMPKTGDFALGLDMANFIKSINNSITNAASANTVVAVKTDIFGKYFLADRSALRFRVGVGIDNYTNRQFVRDDVANLLDPLLGGDPITEIKTVDVRKVRNTTLELGIGYEYRRTLWRVQGYVGAEVFGAFNLHRDIFEYGNPMTETNTNPTFNLMADVTNPLPAVNGYRPLESVRGNTMSLGAALYIGADFFICRNLSIGAEFELEGRYNRTGELSMKTESWLLEQAYVAEEKIKPIHTSFQFRPMGRLNLFIYF